MCVSAFFQILDVNKILPKGTSVSRQDDKLICKHLFLDIFYKQLLKFLMRLSTIY